MKLNISSHALQKRTKKYLKYLNINKDIGVPAYWSNSIWLKSGISCWSQTDRWQYELFSFPCRQNKKITRAGKINKETWQRTLSRGVFWLQNDNPLFWNDKRGNNLNGSQKRINNKAKGCFVDSFSFFGTPEDGTFQISPEEEAWYLVHLGMLKL